MPITRKKKLKTRTSWIYLLVDPRDKHIRYVGHAFNPRARFATYKRGIGTGPEVTRWLLSLVDAGLEPIMMIAGKVTTYTGDFRIDDSIRKGAEKHTIRRLSKSKDDKLLNVAHHMSRGPNGKRRAH